MDGLVREQYVPLLDDVEERLRPSATRLVERYFHEVKQHIIYDLCREEDIKAVCHANGGIPTISDRERYFYDEI